jgi:hypothetical protein
VLHERFQLAITVSLEGFGRIDATFAFFILDAIALQTRQPTLDGSPMNR